MRVVKVKESGNETASYTYDANGNKKSETLLNTNKGYRPDQQKKEWTLVKVFADEGISGTQTKKRTEFNRMIRMCKNKKIEIKLAYLIQRIGIKNLENSRNKGFRHIGRDRKPFSFDGNFRSCKGSV